VTLWHKKKAFLQSPPNALLVWSIAITERPAGFLHLVSPDVQSSRFTTNGRHAKPIEWTLTDCKVRQ
jgi:hypothetical protein